MSAERAARTIALASSNPHKAREWSALLGGWALETLDMSAAPAETGATFWENAVLKAVHGARLASPEVWVIGEDSGLAVEALGGAPGVRSARYAGDGATDADNVAHLLAELGESAQRDAAFRCVIACIAPRRPASPSSTAEPLRAQGALAGEIALSPRGEGGFGYDPVFVPRGHSQTVAELGERWKSEHSHRAEAARSLLALIDRC